MKQSISVDNMENDLALVKRLSKDDLCAYEEIFRSYWPSCFHKAYTVVRDKEGAEEIVQEIFIQLWEKRKSMLIQNLSFYLPEAVKNSSLNYLRKEKIYKTHLSSYLSLVDFSSEVTEEEILYSDLKRNYEGAFDLLPPRSKRIMQLSHLQGYSAPEIAKELNISVKGVEYHIHRGLTIIRRHLKRLSFLVILFPFL